jgi:integrase
MRAWTFGLSSLETGRLVGLALLCFEARYASVALAGAEQLERRHASPRAWKDIGQELAFGTPPGPLPRSSAICQLCTGGAASIVLQYLNARPLDPVAPGEVARTLDALLRGQRIRYLTGWRVTSEILPLQWLQVDWTGRLVRLDPGTTKNREGRSFPFTAALEGVLREQLRVHDDLQQAGRVVPFVFHRRGKEIKDLYGAWRSACRRAGVPGRIPHDFRRTAVRNLERAGVSRSAAMAMVGHKTESIYRRYAIVDAATLREAAAKLDDAAGTLWGTPGRPEAETA